MLRSSCSRSQGHSRRRRRVIASSSSSASRSRSSSDAELIRRSVAALRWRACCWPCGGTCWPCGGTCPPAPPGVAPAARRRGGLQLRPSWERRRAQVVPACPRRCRRVRRGLPLRRRPGARSRSRCPRRCRRQDCCRSRPARAGWRRSRREPGFGCPGGTGGVAACVGSRPLRQSAITKSSAQSVRLRQVVAEVGGELVELLLLLLRDQQLLDALLGLLEALLGGLRDLGDAEDVVAGVGLDRAGDPPLDGGEDRRVELRVLLALRDAEQLAALLLGGGVDGELLGDRRTTSRRPRPPAWPRAPWPGSWSGRPRGRAARAARTAARCRCSSPRSRRRRRSGSPR